MALLPLKRPVPNADVMLNLDAFRATPLVREPFDYVIVPGFVLPQAFEQVVADYPVITKRGSFALDNLQYGPAFTQLLEELRGDAFRRAVEEKFSLSLDGRPTLITVRGACGRRDGNIHTDTENKIISLLLYMNHSWEDDGGRLRLLKSPHIDDVAAEIQPGAGTLLVFRRAENSWHGHKLFIGKRKVIQMNWVTDQKFADYSQARHGWSSFIKKLNPFAAGGY